MIICNDFIGNKYNKKTTLKKSSFLYCIRVRDYFFKNPSTSSAFITFSSKT